MSSKILNDLIAMAIGVAAAEWRCNERLIRDNFGRDMDRRDRWHYGMSSVPPAKRIRGNFGVGDPDCLESAVLDCIYNLIGAGRWSTRKYSG